MKKQLNLICVVMFLFVGLSLLPSLYTLSNSFVEGFKSGISQVEEMEGQGTVDLEKEILRPVVLSLHPKALNETSDKLFNQKDRKWYPASYMKALVWTNAADSEVARHVSILVVLGLFFLVKAIIQFYKLINAINHEVIFDWVNVRRLNRIGRDLLLSFVLTQAYALMIYREAARLFELEGYEYNPWCDFQSMTLIMGLVALLVGRIFAIGLQMKKDQELTI